MVRPWNVTEAVLDQGKWYDYAGQSIHGDYTVALDQSNAAVVTEKVAHEPGVIDYDYTAAAGSRQTYLRGNLIGTTEATSGASPGSPPSAGRAVYSAFGERVYANGVGGGRYGYAGAWGYQAAGGEECGPAGEEFLCDPLAELGWLHVGERYYDPACGRFVQRDPIGIAGGWNVYVYVNNRPAKATDPEGLDGAEYRFRQFIEKPILEGRPEEAWANARAQAAGALVGIGTITIFFGGKYTICAGAGIVGSCVSKCSNQPNGPTPPGWGPNWQWRGSSPRGGGNNWWDPKGGEWRLHPTDKWHKNQHWDYNPWTSWNSPWQNIY